jgi:hypothetical protein
MGWCKTTQVTHDDLQTRMGVRGWLRNRLVVRKVYKWKLSTIAGRVFSMQRWSAEQVLCYRNAQKFSTSGPFWSDSPQEWWFSPTRYTVNNGILRLLAHLEGIPVLFQLCADVSVLYRTFMLGSNSAYAQSSETPESADSHVNPVLLYAPSFV